MHVLVEEQLLECPPKTMIITSDIIKLEKLFFKTPKELNNQTVHELTMGAPIKERASQRSIFPVINSKSFKIRMIYATILYLI